MKYAVPVAPNPTCGSAPPCASSSGKVTSDHAAPPSNETYALFAALPSGRDSVIEPPRRFFGSVGLAAIIVSQCAKSPSRLTRIFGPISIRGAEEAGPGPEPSAPAAARPIASGILLIAQRTSNQTSAAPSGISSLSP